MNVVNELVKVYFEHEWWQKEKLSEEEATDYHDCLLQKGRIVPLLLGSELVGYVESWRINFEQFGRLLCHEPFSAMWEDVQTGKICYLANIWIRKDHRNSWAIKMLRSKFFMQNFACDYFVGEALRKKTQPVKVFKRQEAFSKWAAPVEKEVVLNGSR